jgi:hypothetical protein
MSLRSTEVEEIWEQFKTTGSEAAADVGQSATAVDDGTSSQVRPKLPEEALYGIAGEVVRAIEPHSEADSASLLIQFLVAFGSLVGRGPHTTVEADRHGCNLFCCVVGQSSKGRKGTSWGHIRRLFSMVDAVWSDSRVRSGVSSGEGIIWAVRDPIEKRTGKKVGDDVTYETSIDDCGESDKRLLAIESEFASVLKTMDRLGSTLSPILRQAWDSGDLRVMTKNSPAQASAAHISIVGHITEEELRRNLTSTEAANGFANRFLWVLSRRSKCLPEGGDLQVEDLEPFAQRLKKDVVAGAPYMTELKRDSEAKELWARVYEQLSEGKPGLIGSVTNRAEAQVLRLSLLYAVLDRSTVIRVPHLVAALAVWQYCEWSAIAIFGDSLGYEVADKILANLRSNTGGLTLTEISALFGRNKNERAIRDALSLLQSRRLAHCEKLRTSGRSIERWFARFGTN